MAIQSKPIPALYVVYILRSTVRPASLYIGSTPHPPRRLNQHNGKAKGGAARTSRSSLRPWEMVGVVSGFPSMVGALKFEWALNNPHLSLHISPEDRLTVSTQRKRNGHPKRPRHSIASILANTHLLIRVPSFARWPLKLHFFNREVHTKWDKYCATPGVELLRETLEVLTDFKPPVAEPSEANNERNKPTEGMDEDETAEEGEQEEQTGPRWGIHALPLDHSPLVPYLEKGQTISTFEREGKCVVCHQHLDPGKGLYAICSNGECEGVGHLDCWSQHLLSQRGEDKGDEVILPMQGHCPECMGVVRWADMMRELTLRIRGQDDVSKLLKKRKKAIGGRSTKRQATKSTRKVKKKADDATVEKVV